MPHDYVIVGGGIYGAGVAWQLATRGADVLLLEAATIASGASGGPGKRGVRANGRDVRELPLMRLAYDLWPTLADNLGAPTGYERTGQLLLIEEQRNGPRDGLPSAPARQWLQQQHDIPTQLLDRAGVLALEPNVSDAIVGALYCPLDGVADHTATTRALAQAAVRAGATVREHTRVEGLEHADERVSTLITAQGERIGVNRTVLLLSNLHVVEFVREALGIALPVWRMVPQVLVTEPVEPLPLSHLIGHDSRTLSMKPLTGSRVMITGGWRGRWNEQTGRCETIPAQIAGNLAEASAVYPALRGIGIAQSDATRSESDCVDDIPIIGQLPGARNLLVGVGWSGHGFAIAPAVAQLLADWALTGQQPALLRPFAYDRFVAREV
ncbi:MAG TPA: FAD-dependent oxidoreductase [Ktedonobacterales bacterium]|nr:FAD-dependent oxidoreductase [Ktedonobacterales bacterium]